MGKHRSVKLNGLLASNLIKVLRGIGIELEFNASDTVEVTVISDKAHYVEVHPLGEAPDITRCAKLKFEFNDGKEV